MIVTRLSTAVVVAAALSSAVLSAGCTSFAFKSSGKGTAPSELQNREQMVLVNGGSFDMGNKTGEPDEFPTHRVTLTSYLIDRVEVSIADYKRCVEARVCTALVAPSPAPETPVPTTHAVVGVPWYGAKKYCEWVGKRLPTEAEWEYAARKPHFLLYPWKSGFETSRANARGAEDGYETTAPVGSFPTGATPSGILDLAGNAAEWTADWYEATWYQKSPERNPTGPEAPTGQRVVRGGSWSDPSYNLRATARTALDPNYSNNAVGFRCAATP